METPTKFLLTAIAVLLIGILIISNLWMGIILALVAFALYLLRDYMQKSSKYGSIIFWIALGLILLILLRFHMFSILALGISVIAVYTLIKLIEWVWTKIIPDAEKDVICFLKWLFTSGNSLFNR